MHLADFWTVSDNPPPAPDCFIVPSYAVRNKHIPTKQTMATIQLAYQWWKKFPHALVILSTGDNQRLGLGNAPIMASYARKLGLPAEYIIEENTSLNTYENLIFSQKIMQLYRRKKPALITYDLHTRRTIAVAKRLGWKHIYWVSAYSPGDSAYGIKKFQTKFRCMTLLYEIVATLYNKLKGEI